MRHWVVLLLGAAACAGGADSPPTSTPSSSRAADRAQAQQTPAPQRVQPSAEPKSHQSRLDAKEQRIRALLKRHDVEDRFHIIQRWPFLVVGDDTPRRVQRRVDRTISYSVTRLKRAFGWEDPDKVLVVWLFKNERSYNKYTKKLLGDEPDTPYGYYSPSSSALVMNIGTGGGTLIHEIVHPYIEANFPESPAWFNEGLGSLFEASEYRGKDIYGLTNWRLPGLKKAIRRGNLTSFADLLATDEGEFYRDDAGTNYAQARYLLYYLQEQGLLRQYYADYTAAKKTDPTGYKTLVTTLDADDMEAFQSDWERWILRLRWR